MLRANRPLMRAVDDSEGQVTVVTHVQRDANGLINGPQVHLPEAPDRTFIGEAHELLEELHLLLTDASVNPEVDEGLRRIVDVALGVGFDYGVEFGREGRA
jgi:hypothetical protein